MKYFIFLSFMLLHLSAQTQPIPKIFYISFGLEYSKVELTNKNGIKYSDFKLDPNGFFEKQPEKKYNGFIFRNNRWEEENKNMKFSLSANNKLYIENENILITGAEQKELSFQNYILEDSFLTVKMEKGALSTSIELLTTKDNYHIFEKVIDYRDLRKNKFNSIDQFIQTQCNQNAFETSSFGLFSFQSKIVDGVAKCNKDREKGYIVHSYYDDNKNLTEDEIAGEWSIQKIGESNIDILLIKPFNKKDGYYTFFTELNGVLYKGELTQKGTKEKITIFNKIAMDSIKNSMINQRNQLFEDTLADQILLAIN